MQQEPPVAPPCPAEGPAHSKVGTLTYAKAGLVVLFAWLLWGDVCYWIHSRAVYGCLNLAFKRQGVPNWLMGLLLTSMPSIINVVLYPVVSTASDRTRTRWGRRIPYLATAPLGGACVILLGFSEDIGLSLSRLAHWSPAATIVLVLALSFALFRLTDTCVSAVFWFLFNDVVPQPFLARFTSLFSMVGTLTIALYQWFFYQYAETNMREICLVAGLIYAFGYTLMCFFVKEGEYPPPPPGMDSRKGFLGLAFVFLKECFSHRFYWLFFLTNALWGTTAACGFAGVFLSRDSLGLTLAQIGKIGAVTSLASAVLLYPAGILADRLHPLRFMRFTIVIQSIWALTGLNWLFWNPSPHAVLVIIIGTSVIAVPLSAMHNAAGMPMFMHLLPNDRFGQFCSANGIVGSVIAMISGAVAGLFLDAMLWVGVNWLHQDSNFGYRFIPVWEVAFMFASTAALFLLYREWLKRGGRAHYKPPDPAIPDA